MGQPIWQAPLRQAWPALHVTPQAPQLVVSLEVVTQRPLHEVWPAGHATSAQGSTMRTQRAWHTVFDGHTVAPSAQGFAAQWPPTQS